MIVSPTEPSRLRAAANSVSNMPEELGGDILIVPHHSWGGHILVQRKELKDLVASLSDGRLSEQIQKMRGARLGILLVEGRPRWTSDGEMLTDYGARVTWRSWLGLMWSIRDEGIWVDFTDNLPQTIEYLEHLEAWAKKEKHSSLHASRPGPTKRWGRVGNRDWERWVLMSLPGVGGEIADRILDELGMPLGWRVTREELMKVKGLGKGKIEKMYAAVPEGAR